MKVLLVASTGGHFQAMQKLQPFWENHNCCWVTFCTPGTLAVLQDYPVYWAYSPTNRNIPNLLRNFVLATQVLLKERPQLILSTGAGVAVPFLVLGKLLGCQTVFV
ncbi:MAG: UDP-N-acetylglucosamine--LPS N-acetylglucosamine transferase, partial [Microcystis sp.]